LEVLVVLVGKLDIDTYPFVTVKEIADEED
jgi:hypothetical protein